MDIPGIIIIIALVLTMAGHIVWKLIVSFRQANRQETQKQFGRIKLLYDKIQLGLPIAQSDIYYYAKNTLTREATYQLLQNSHLTRLFPEEFYTIEKAAESNLVSWLEFPTELGACPDEIEHLKKVIIAVDEPVHFVHYHVYRFRVNHPHWAATQGWMLGVVVPYTDTSKPYDHPNSTFSRLGNKAGANLPDEEAQWVHENISLCLVNRDRCFPTLVYFH
jgi:hypothetical protein